MLPGSDIRNSLHWGDFPPPVSLNAAAYPTSAHGGGTFVVYGAHLGDLRGSPAKWLRNWLRSQLLGLLSCDGHLLAVGAQARYSVPQFPYMQNADDSSTYLVRS